MSTWKAGDKAVCVDDHRGTTELFDYPNGYVKKGVIYLVESVSVCQPDTTFAGQTALFIVGLPIIDLEDGLPEPWQASRFRKVVPVSERVGVEIEAGLAQMARDTQPSPAMIEQWESEGRYIPHEWRHCSY